MNIDNKSLRPEELEVMSSQQLDELLHKELEKENPDSEIVLPILRTLEKREAGDPANDVDVDAVWKAYQEGLQKDIVPLDRTVRRSRKPYRWIGRVAAVAAIVCLLIVAAPKAMGAENIFEIIGRWTQTIFEFFNPTDATEPPEEYVFKTDHPGLQQIYDAVVEQGVTHPVVPSWVPDGFVLDEVKVTKTPLSRKIYAGLYNGDMSITIVVEIYKENRSNQYSKDESAISIYEHSGVKHYIVSNEESLVAAWVTDNLECMILTNCQETVLCRMIDSVYTEGIK